MRRCRFSSHFASVKSNREKEKKRRVANSSAGLDQSELAIGVNTSRFVWVRLCVAVCFLQAYHMRPSIIFFDEIDGLAPVRSSRQDHIHRWEQTAST